MCEIFFPCSDRLLWCYKCKSLSPCPSKNSIQCDLGWDRLHMNSSSLWKPGAKQTGETIRHGLSNDIKFILLGDYDNWQGQNLIDYIELLFEFVISFLFQLTTGFNTNIKTRFAIAAATRTKKSFSETYAKLSRAIDFEQGHIRVRPFPFTPSHVFKCMRVSLTNQEHLMMQLKHQTAN